MKTAADRKKDEIIANVSERLRKHLPDQLAEPAAQFANRYYAGVAPDEIAESPPEDLYGAALAHWQLAASQATWSVNCAPLQPRLCGTWMAIRAHHNRDRG